jgi:hypothetical protein
MHPFTDYDRVYVINLANRLDRRREMTEQFAIVDCDANQAPVHWFSAIRPAAADGFPTLGARGCFMSHLGVLQNAVEDRLERILILEDDVDFSQGFRADFADANARLRDKDWSIFYGGYAVPSGARFDFSDGVLALAPPAVGLQTTHFMGIRGDSIREIRDYLGQILTRPPGHPDGGPMHVDGAYSRYRNDFPGRNTFVHKKMLGVQRPSRTDIHDLKWYDKAPGVRTLAAALRKLRR